MTETEKKVSRFLTGLGANRYRELFALLESHQLVPLGKSNTETLLFQRRQGGSESDDVLAFRLKPEPVISFPKSYWSPRASLLSELLEDFTYAEKPVTRGPVSDSQYSAGQIAHNRVTHERIMGVCRLVCDSLT